MWILPSRASWPNTWRWSYGVSQGVRTILPNSIQKRKMIHWTKSGYVHKPWTSDDFPYFSLCAWSRCSYQAHMEGSSFGFWEVQFGIKLLIQTSGCFLLGQVRIDSGWFVFMWSPRKQGTAIGDEAGQQQRNCGAHHCILLHLFLSYEACLSGFLCYVLNVHLLTSSRTFDEFVGNKWVLLQPRRPSRVEWQLLCLRDGKLLFATPRALTVLSPYLRFVKRVL